MAERVVLAYSGGLDTSVAVRWLIENEGVEVIAVAVNVGQAAERGGEDWDAIRTRALAAGVTQATRQPWEYAAFREGHRSGHEPGRGELPLLASRDTSNAERTQKCKAQAMRWVTPASEEREPKTDLCKIAASPFVLGRSHPSTGNRGCGNRLARQF